MTVKRLHALMDLEEVIYAAQQVAFRNLIIQVECVNQLLLIAGSLSQHDDASHLIDGFLERQESDSQGVFLDRKLSASAAS